MGGTRSSWCLAARLSRPRGMRRIRKARQRTQDGRRLDIPLTPEVLDVPIPNAFAALPGGRVYLFNSLLSRAEQQMPTNSAACSPTNSAMSRIAIRLMIQSGGTSFLIGLLFGDITGAARDIRDALAARCVLLARREKSPADAFAIATMYRLGRCTEAAWRVPVQDYGRAIGPQPGHSRQPSNDGRSSRSCYCGRRTGPRQDLSF